MLTGVVHKDDNGVVWFGDYPVRDPEDMPRRRAWRGTVWYATSTIDSADWGRLMAPGDEAFGPMPGEVLGVKFRVGSRNRLTVLAGSAWGVNSADPNKSHDRIKQMMIQAATAGIQVKRSIAATAVQVYLDRYDGKDGRPPLRQLPSRWRGMAHAALHGGPIAVLRGGAPYAVQMDVRSAYLAALYQPVPVLGKEDKKRVGGWYTHGERRWSRLRNLVGIADCTVRISEDFEPSALPPLPVHLRCGSVYARGLLRGCWTIAQIRDAEERGEVEVLKVHQFCFAPVTQPLFAEAADFFNTLPRDLGKRLYTRFWGKFGTRGGFLGVKQEEPVDGQVPASGLWWRFDGIPLDSHRARPTYRPDLAAFVSAANHRNVMATMRRLKTGSVVACHVDAIWTTDVVAAARICAGRDVPGAWRTKRTGPLRFYGTGCYTHGTALAASGYNQRVQGTLSRERLEKWIQGTTHRRQLLDARRWSADPATDPGATSRSLRLEMDTEVSPTEGPTVYDRCWSVGGWMRGPDEEHEPPSPPEAPLSTLPPLYVGAPMPTGQA
jgi:hypothetical protein